MVSAVADSEVVSAKGSAQVREPSVAERTVARRTALSRATIPDIELGLEVEMDTALERCRREECSLDGLLLAACARALRQVPEANGAYRDGRFEAYSRVNIGLVVAAPDAYVIPTVFDADSLTATELGQEVERLEAQVAAGRLTAAAFSGATFTLWNAGALGLTRAGIVINPPQAGALAAGRVREVAVVRGAEVLSRRVMELTLVCDHRILYGASAAAFLREVAAGLETGAQ